MLPGTEVAVNEDDAAPALVVRIFDDGARYVVVQGESARTLSDPERRCDDRADAAAVAIALLVSPVLATPPPPPVPSPPVATPEPVVAVPAPPIAPPRSTPPPAKPVSTSYAPAHTDIDVELNAQIDGSGPSGPGFGGGARFVVTRMHFGGAFGVQATSPVTLPLPDGAVSLTRLPFDLSFRGGYRWRRLEVAGELGFAVLLELARGEQVANPVSRTGVDLGLRVAVQGRAWLTRRVALFAGVQAIGIPAPIELGVHDDGIVGKTPNYWLGGVFGLVLRAR
jgi:hypothetical protein